MGQIEGKVALVTGGSAGIGAARGGRAALVLATDASSFTTGAEFFVDGGLAQV